MTEPKQETYEDVQGEVITDERTGEQIPKGANSLILSSNQNTQIEISKVGTLELTPLADEVLNEKLDPKDVKIRPDGLVYLPWTYYANKLNRAFGRLQWGLLPQGAPHVKPQGEYGDMLVVWGHWLAIKGVPIAFAYGETTYKPSNATMSYGDACEGAKSISLARCCKQLGIALELWDADWIVEWKRENAETYDNPNQNARQKKLWRKKGVKAPQKAQAGKSETKPATEATMPVDDHQKPANAPSVEKTGSRGSVEMAETLSDGFTPNQILGSKNGELVKQIVDLSKKTTVDVCKYVGTLEKGKKVTIGQVVKALTTPEGETE